MAELSKYEKNFIENWKRMRASGRKKYSISTGIVFAIIMFIVNRGITSMRSSFSESFLSTQALMSFIFYLAISLVVFYFIAWPYNEKKYLKLTDTDTSSIEE